MVRDGLADESGAKLLEQQGIDFAPTEEFIQSLKTADASEAFLTALRAAVAPGLSPAHAALKGGSTTASPPTSAKKPLNQVQIFALLVGQVPSHRVTLLVQERGIDFEPTDDYLQEVRLAGGEAQEKPTTQKNVSWLPAAEEAGLDVLLTTDRKMRHQQNLVQRKIALVVLTGTTKWSRVRLHFQRIASAVNAATPGSVDAKIEVRAWMTSPSSVLTRAL